MTLAALALDVDACAGRPAPHAAHRLAAAARAGSATGVDAFWLQTLDRVGLGLTDAAFGVGYARAEAVLAAANDIPAVGWVTHDDAAQVAGMLAGGVAVLVAADSAAARACRDAQALAGRSVRIVSLSDLHVAVDATGEARPAGALTLTGAGVARLLGCRAAPPLAAGGDETQMPSSLATPLGSAA